MSNEKPEGRKRKIFRFGAPAVRVRSHRYGTLKLRTLTVKDAVFVEEQLKQDLPARLFVANLVHNQLVSPQLPQEAVHEWKDRLLLRAATAWVTHREVLGKHLNTELEPFEAIKQAVASYLDEQNQKLAETFRGMASSPAFSSALANIKLFNDQLGTQFLDLSRQNQHIVNSLLGSTNGLEGIVGQLPSISSGWLAEIGKAQPIIDSIAPVLESVRSQLADIGHMARVAQSSFALIDWASINDSLPLPVEIDSGIQSIYLRFSQSHTRYLESLQASTSTILALPPEFTRLPTVEYFTGVDLLETVLVEEHQVDETDEKQVLRTEIVAETEEGLREELIFLDPGLIRLWEGAEHALRSNNPDRARHVATSLRELFTHVLHKLSPDNEIRQWNQSPELYDKNKPTRKARLLFICRGVNQGPFADFLAKDIDAAIAFIQLFQRGTHEILIPFSEEQLVALKIRMEGLIRFLITIYRQSR
jgi:hypothetical protein